MSTGMMPLEDSRNATVRVRQNAGDAKSGGAVMTLNQAPIESITDGKFNNSVLMTKEQAVELRDRIDEWLNGTWRVNFEDF